MKSFHKKGVFSFLAFPALGGSQRLFWQLPSRQCAFQRYFPEFSYLLGLPFSYCFLWLELADATALLVFVSFLLLLSFLFVLLFVLVALVVDGVGLVKPMLPRLTREARSNFSGCATATGAPCY